MFIGFFYMLRSHGFHVTLNEWMTLTEGLMLGLHNCSFTGFYDLCRAVLVHTEAEYDKFDSAFLEYFDGVPFPEEKLPQELLDWLKKPGGQGRYDEWQADLNENLSFLEIEEMFKERMDEQREEHNCGNYWVGTHGMSVFGNSGLSPVGIRVGGQSMYRRAFRVAGERQYRDFRKDNTLDIRQFQMAFRMLRQYSSRSQGEKTEFDVDETIHKTSDKGGVLDVQFKRPRKNTVKVLMLMDSGGSMEYYSNLCSMLFQAAERDNQFKELHVYYFHNCLTPSVYTAPQMKREHSVSTEWVLKNFDRDYKVIFVGDALLDMYELLEQRFDWRTGESRYSGMDYLKRFKERYPHLVWLNPEEAPTSEGFWGESYGKIAKIVDMYPLSVAGLEKAMKKLLVSK